MAIQRCRIWNGSAWKDMHANQVPAWNSVQAANPSLVFTDITGRVGATSNLKSIWDGSAWQPLDTAPLIPEVIGIELGDAALTVVFPALAGNIGDLLWVQGFGVDGSIQNPDGVGWLRTVSESSGGNIVTKGWWKIATTTSEATDLFNQGGSGISGAFIRMANVRGGEPLTDGITADVPAGGDLMVPGLAPVATPNLSMCVVATEDDNATASPGYTLLEFKGENGLSKPAVRIFTKDFATGGPTADVPFSNGTGAIEEMAAGHVSAESP